MASKDIQDALVCAMCLFTMLFSISPCSYSVVDCGELNPPVNGMVNVSGTTTNSTASYSCDEGYDLVGVSTRTCLSSGDWSHDEVECKRELFLHI